MAGFFKRFVDKLSGYPEDADADYVSDNDYDTDTDQYDYSNQPKGFGQPQEQQFTSSTYVQEPKMQYTAPVRNTAASKVVPIRPASKGEQQLVILQPNNIQSAQRVCDHLRAGHTVICNIENVDAKIAQRVIDFISGSTYAMDGNVKPIDARAHSFVAVPRSVSLVDKDFGSPSDTSEYSDYSDYVEPFRMAH